MPAVQPKATHTGTCVIVTHMRTSPNDAADPRLLVFAKTLHDNRSVKPTLTQITDQLILSYARAGGINHIDGKNLPSKTTIASITHDLLRLVFPGFFDERIIH